MILKLYHWQVGNICVYLVKTMMKLVLIRYVKLQERKIKNFKKEDFNKF